MKKVLFLLLASCLLCLPSMAKKYRFQPMSSYEVLQVRVAQEGTKFVKAWGVASNADKAIVQAQMNAIAACLFTGVEATETAGRIPPICAQEGDAYAINRTYFDNFFSTGEFLKYAKTVNTRYPSGEDNVKTPEGRKVGVYLQIMYDSLRKQMEKDGIVKSLGNYF